MQQYDSLGTFSADNWCTGRGCTWGSRRSVVRRHGNKVLACLRGYKVGRGHDVAYKSRTGLCGDHSGAVCIVTPRKLPCRVGVYDPGEQSPALVVFVRRAGLHARGLGEGIAGDGEVELVDGAALGAIERVLGICIGVCVGYREVFPLEFAKILGGKGCGRWG